MLNVALLLGMLRLSKLLLRIGMRYRETALLPQWQVFRNVDFGVGVFLRF